MTNNLKSSVSPVEDHPEQPDSRNPAPHSWLKVGAVAAASAVLGGLAAAWFYRKTLSQLREAETRISPLQSAATEDESEEDF